MAGIERTRVIAASPADIWSVLADFGAISSWAGNVDHSCILFAGPGGGPLGTARRVQIKHDALVERIIEFDPPRALAYEIEGLPRRLRRLINRWTVEPAGPDTTAVTLTSTVDIGSGGPQKLAERMLCRFLARQSDTMLAGLAHRWENARV